MSAPEPVEKAPEGRRVAERGEVDAFTLRLAARGDERACRAVLACYRGRVYALISRVLHGRQRALVDDLAQEVFLRTFRHLEGFDPDGPAKLSTWIYKIASRLCIDELRRRRPQSSHDRVDELAARAAAHPEDETRQLRLREALARALDELNGEQRAAFVLYEFHGQSYADIASALELPVGTVRSRISRARKALQSSLATEGREYLAVGMKGRAS